MKLKQRWTAALLSSGLLVGAVGLAHASLMPHDHSPVQVVTKEIRLPNGFVKVESFTWNGSPAQVRVEHLSPQQARVMWDRTMGQFQAMQASMNTQFAQMQRFLSASFAQPFWGMEPAVPVSLQAPIFGAPYWTQVSSPVVLQLQLVPGLPVAAAPATVTPPAHQASPWPAHGIVSARYTKNTAQHPKLPL